MEFPFLFLLVLRLAFWAQMSLRFCVPWWRVDGLAFKPGSAVKTSTHRPRLCFPDRGKLPQGPLFPFLLSGPLTLRAFPQRVMIFLLFRESSAPLFLETPLF